MTTLLVCMFSFTATAQTTITIDGDLSEWTDDMRLDVPPNRPIITWDDGADGRDNSPADPEDLDYLIDLNFAGLYATDDEDWLYLRIDMNERADVRRILTDTVPDGMYDGGAISIRISTDPNPMEDFQDTTGMTWGWYENGYDFVTTIWPFDEDYQDSTGFQAPISEHSQEGNGYAFSIYERNPELGIKVAWNEDYNKAEIAIPKSVILQPQHLAEEFHNSPFVAFMLASSAFNHRTGDQWWSQDIANNDGQKGYTYTYEADWSGEDPSGGEPTSTFNDGITEVPVSLTLYQNYPNPFNPSTQIRFAVPEAQNVVVDVYDMLGRKVETLLNQQVSAGAHSVTFDAAGFSSGMYLYTVTAGSQVATGKMMLIK
ncbi:T9SS type A sorting domain-containing protein [Balneolales bacterium ANBcel1]|nr:T9SS type A sorting domain-containing protein [Balneolales bacterium ANBcel1]